MGTRPRDLNPEAFSPAGTHGSQSEYSTVYDRPPAEMIETFDRHAGYVGFATLLKAMGMSYGKSTPTTGHYEWPWQDDTLQIGSVDTDATTAGEAAIVVLASASMYDTSETLSGSAEKTSYPIVGDVYELPDGKQVYVTAKDTTTDPHQVTLKPLDSTVDITGLLGTGGGEFDELIFVYRLDQEGSGLPAMRAPRIIKYTNTFGIAKAAFRSTGSEWTNRVYFEPVPGQEGSINIKIEANTLAHFEKTRDGLLFAGQQPDNISSTPGNYGIDVTLRGTEGFWTFAKAEGGSANYTSGSYALSDLDTISKYMEDERATESKDLLYWVGGDLYRELENAFNNTLQNDGLATFVNDMIPRFRDMAGSFETYQYQESDKALSFGYYAIRKGGFNYHIKKMDIFNDVKSFGNSAFTYRQSGIVHPLDMVRSTDGVRRGMVGYEYKELNGYSREFVVGEVAGIGVGASNTPWRLPTNENDLYTMGMLCELAGHFACGNKVVIQEPTS